MFIRLSIGILMALGTYSISALAAQPKSTQILKIGNRSEPKSLDPAITTGVPESKIVGNLFEGLVDLDPFDMQPIPGVASSWSISPDGLEYTFHLRPDAQWSDGTKITAHDFKYSFLRALAQDTASEYAYQLFYLKNGEAYNTGTIKDPEQVGIQVKDDQTLILTLHQPTPYFLQLCAFHTLFPVPKHIIEKHQATWTQPEHIVSNGPFKMSEWKLNQHIKLIPNDKYWDKSKVALKEVYFYPIENLATEEKSFFAGQLDMTYEVPGIKIPSYLEDQKANPAKPHPFVIHPYLGTYYYRLNVTKKPLDDLRVRKALALAIDRKLIVEKITQGNEQPATGFTPPETAGYTFAGVLPKEASAEAIKEAKDLLAQAGYPDGKNFPKLDILYNTNEDHKRIALAIQSMWKKNLGIESTLNNQEWKVYLTNQSKMEYLISRAGWIGDYPDPNTFLDMFVTNGGQNQTGWSNPEYDALIKKAAATTLREERYAIFKQAEAILMKELPVIPVYTYTIKRLMSPSLKMVDKSGAIRPWAMNIQDRLFLKNAILAE